MNPEIIEREGHPHAVIPIEIYQQLVEDSEMLADIRAYDQAKASEEETFPVDILERITLNKEHPLKVWREYRHLTQEQLAEASGEISSTDISEIESGKKSGSIKVLKSIAAILNVDVDMINLNQ